MINSKLLPLLSAIGIGPGTINVRDYGATGDGTTDDTVAIQAAINAEAGVNGSVFLPTGDFLVTNGLLATAPVSIVGNGQIGSRLIVAASVSTATVTVWSA
jgi:hypothetical protein